MKSSLFESGLRRHSVPGVLAAALMAFLLTTGSAQANHEVWVHDVPVDANGNLLNGQSEIGTINVHTGAYTSVVIAPFLIYDIAWSPDGRLFVIEPADGNETRLREINMEADPPTFGAGCAMSNGSGYPAPWSHWMLTNSLVFGADGTLYTAGWIVKASGWTLGLLEVNVDTCAGTLKIDFGDNFSDYRRSSSGDLAFANDEFLYLTTVGQKADDGTYPNNDLLRLDLVAES
ncbi:MAG: hypothetical protein ACI9MR_001695, partial [Myxococcota bacterium]